MSAIYHINPQDESKPCGGQMKGGNCKWPNQPHFDTKEKADEAASALKIQKYGAVPGMSKKAAQPQNDFDLKEKDLKQAEDNYRTAYFKYEGDLDSSKNHVNELRGAVRQLSDSFRHPVSNEDDMFYNEAIQYNIDQRTSELKEIEEESERVAQELKYAEQDLKEARYKLIDASSEEQYFSPDNAKEVYKLSVGNPEAGEAIELRVEEILGRPSFYEAKTIGGSDGVSNAVTGTLRIKEDTTDAELDAFASKYENLVTASDTILSDHGTRANTTIGGHWGVELEPVGDFGKFRVNDSDGEIQSGKLSMKEALVYIRENYPSS